MEKFIYYLPAIKIIIAAIITIIGIIVKLKNQNKILKTKKVVYINHTPGQEIAARILFLISAFYIILKGIEGIKIFNDWYFYTFLFIGVIYFLVSLRDIKVNKKISKR